MININIVDDRISGSVNGKPFSTKYTKETWDNMVALQAKEQGAATYKDIQAIWEAFTKLTVYTPSEQIETLSPFLRYTEKDSTYYLVHEGKTCPIPVPKSLVDKILRAAEKKLPVDPVIKFFLRTLRNPNIIEGDIVSGKKFLKEVCDYVTQTFVSPVLLKKFKEEGYSGVVATNLATIQQTPLTLEGLLCTKKVVSPLKQLERYKWILDSDGNKKQVLRDGYTKVVDPDTGEETITEPKYSEDRIYEPVCMGSRGDAFHCGSAKDAPLGHVIRVGQEIRLPSWEFVDCNPNHSCVKGIHSGNQDYLNGWENPSNVTLDLLVDPGLIGAVPYNDVSGVIRSLGGMPIGVKDRLEDNKNLYHSSEYAALNDRRYAEYRQEVIEKFSSEKEKVVIAVDEKISNLPA